MVPPGNKAKRLSLVNRTTKTIHHHHHHHHHHHRDDSCFDGTMASCVDAEVCEFVGIYLLPLLANIIDKNSSGLYRDDGVIFLRNVNGQNMDRVRKTVIKIFKKVGFKIEIQSRLKIVNFLDVIFNLANGT